MYGILCIGLFGNPFGLAALVVTFVSKRRGVLLGVGIAALVLAALTAFTGIGGYLYGMSVVEDAVAFADAASRAELYAMGQAEAMNNVWFGAIAAALPTLAGALALARGASMEPPSPDEPPSF